MQVPVMPDSALMHVTDPFRGVFNLDVLGAWLRLQAIGIAQVGVKRPAVPPAHLVACAGFPAQSLGNERYADCITPQLDQPLRIFQKVIGIEAKLNQYQAGEKFIAAVEEVGGPELVNRAWEGPDNLPSMDEIKTPQLWIDRMSTDADQDVAVVS